MIEALSAKDVGAHFGFYPLKSHLKIEIEAPTH
jgi:hypothetical protein